MNIHALYNTSDSVTTSKDCKYNGPDQFKAN